MTPEEPDDLDRFEADLLELKRRLAEAFKAENVQHFVDEGNDTLYVVIPGLEAYSETDMEVIAAPILNEWDLDFEEIILLPD